MLRRTTPSTAALSLATLSLATLAAGSSGCGGAGDAASPRNPAAAAAPALASCARVNPGVGATPLAAKGAGRAGGAVALAKSGSRTVAYVADEDARAVHAVEIRGEGGSTGAVLSTTSVAGTPSQILLADDGRLFVALRDAGAVQVLEPAADPAAPLAARCLAPAAAEPVGLALTPDAGTLLVASGWGAALTAYEVATLKRAFEVPLAREPRAVLVSDDGRKAFVSHVVGGLVSVVDLGARSARTLHVDGAERKLEVGPLDDDEQPRRACQGFALAKSVEPAGRIFLPQVLVDPGETSQPSRGGYGDDGMVPAEAPAVAVLDEDRAAPLATSLTVGPGVEQFTGGRERGNACLLPRAAAVDPERGELLVACMGIDALVAYDARAAAPHTAELRRVPLPAGPTGLALDLAGRRAVVWSQFERTLSVVPLGDAPVPHPQASPAIAMIPVAAPAPAPAFEDAVALGRRLFHAADPRISRDGRACASCHPSGREDALTWATPDGPRQTPMLAGRIDGTAPYGWNGDGDSVRAHLTQTLERLGGSGLEARELDALIAYVRALPAPPRPAEDAEGAERALARARARRGAEVFRSAEAGCASCHAEGQGFTDGARHDVGSQMSADKDAAFDTPSLRFIGGTAPYFHDGRYGTLREVLRHADGKMGRTAHLAPADLDALEAYLRSL